jgi:flagellar motility protein MotE (MotC chaperone)
MKIFASPVIVAVLAILIYAGTSTVLILKELGKTAEPLPPPTERPPKVWGFKTQAVDDLIAELTSERERTAEEHKSLETLRARLATERAEVEQVREEIKALREALDQRVLQIEESEIKNLKSLANTYSAMKTASIVAIFHEMNEDMAVKLVSLMKPDRISQILEEMARERENPGEEPAARRAVRFSDKLRLIQTAKKTSS